MNLQTSKVPSMPKRAMVLAAGLGLRMRPLTEQVPKPLVEVAGRPLISPILDALAAFGIEEAVVNIHYLADQMRTFASGVTSPKLILSDETAKLLDSGGGVKNALPNLGREPFFVLNADSFWIDGPQSNLSRLVEAWNPETMDAILLLASGAQITGYAGKGDFLMGSDGHLSRRPERIVSPFVYAGVAIMKPELFDKTPEGPFSLNVIFDRAIEARRLFGLRLDGEWLHVGTPDAVIDAQLKLTRSIL